VRVLFRLLRLEPQQRLFTAGSSLQRARLRVGALGGPAGRHGERRDDQPDHRNQEEEESNDHSAGKDALAP